MSAAYRTIRIRLKAKPARKASWCVASVLAIEAPSPETTLIPLIPAIRKKTSLRPEATKKSIHTTPVGLAQEAFGYCFLTDRPPPAKPYRTDRDLRTVIRRASYLCHA